jgi:hypothetical protein
MTVTILLWCATTHHFILNNKRMSVESARARAQSRPPVGRVFHVNLKGISRPCRSIRHVPTSRGSRLSASFLEGFSSHEKVYLSLGKYLETHQF